MMIHKNKRQTIQQCWILEDGIPNVWLAAHVYQADMYRPPSQYNVYMGDSITPAELLYHQALMVSIG